jgi:hypothetical protein
MVVAAHHDGLTVATCVVADPEAEGGSQATVRIAKADVMLTDANLRCAYRQFGDLGAPRVELCDQIHARPHRVSGRPPVDMLVEEPSRLRRLPVQPYRLPSDRAASSDAPPPRSTSTGASTRCPVSCAVRRSGSGSTAMRSWSCMSAHRRRRCCA